MSFDKEEERLGNRATICDPSPLFVYFELSVGIGRKERQYQVLRKGTLVL